MSWFPTSGRSFPWRHWEDSYRLTVVEILLQRTRAETIASFAPGFFNRYPDWQALAVADAVDVQVILRPIGLHVRRAASLTALAVAVVERGVDPASREAPGVGQYVSRAVRVASHNAPAAMIDANWVRVLRRAFGGAWMSDYRYDVRLQSIADAVVHAGGDARAVNWAVLDIGAVHCRPRQPLCRSCPLMDHCEHGVAGAL